VHAELVPARLPARLELGRVEAIDERTAAAWLSVASDVSRRGHGMAPSVAPVGARMDGVMSGFQGRAASDAGDPEKREVGARAAQLIRQQCHIVSDVHPCVAVSAVDLVERRGLEPRTFCMPCRCSPN
jgi:hypothetical protein